VSADAPFAVREYDLTGDPASDGPAYVPPREHRAEFTAAALRDAHPAERALRIVLALVVLAGTVVTCAVWFQGPREVRANRLLAAAAAGRVTRVDTVSTPGRIRWRTRGGAAYQADLTFTGPDVRASVEAQPYVRAHPGSVTYGPVRTATVPPPLRVAMLVVTVGCVLALLVSPQPRYLTRWAWFWTFRPFVGVVAYLLLAGSVRRGRPGTPTPRQRFNGWQTYFGLLLVSVLVQAGAMLVRDRLHPVDPDPGVHTGWVVTDGPG
jgi:hypothetical protein